MDFKQIEAPAMYIVGVGVNTSMQNAPKDCLPVWVEFMKHRPEVDNVIDNKRAYGVSFAISLEEGTFRYTAGVEVGEFARIPAGMEKIAIPASSYLIFTHKGKLDTLGQTYGQIMEWVKKMGKAQKDFWLEVYGENWSDRDDSEFEIWAAIK